VRRIVPLLAALVFAAGCGSHPKATQAGKPAAQPPKLTAGEKGRRAFLSGERSCLTAPKDLVAGVRARKPAALVRLKEYVRQALPDFDQAQALKGCLRTIRGRR
jgi:hypothetical protein